MACEVLPVYCSAIWIFYCLLQMYVITKWMWVLVKYWRNCGIMIVVLSDDGIGTRKDKMLANQASELVQKSLWRAHF